MSTATPEPTLAPPLEDEQRAALPNGPYIAPRVNLLPPEIAERKSLRKLQALLAVGVLACGGVMGYLYTTADSGRASAQSSLDQAVAESTVLQNAKTKLLPVQITRSKVQSTRQSLVTAMSAEVLWSRSLDQLRQKLPDGIELQTVTVTPVAVAATGATGAAGSTSTPTTGSTPAATTPSTSSASGATPAGTIASVTIAGKATDHDTVAAFLEALNKIPGWDGSYLTQTTSQSGTPIDFTVTANVGSAALSHRYTDGS